MLRTISSECKASGTCTEVFSARLADPTVAMHLGVEVGSPRLSLTRVVHDPACRAVEHIHALYQPDRYQYRMSLTRERGGPRNLWSSPVVPFPRGRSKL